MLTPEQHLWQAVIVQAIRDAVSDNSLQQQRAWTWFFTNDYRWVCTMAGLQPDKLRRKLIEQFVIQPITQEGVCTMQKKPTESQEREAKALLRALYTQQNLTKEIGQLTLQDVLALCQQSRAEEEKITHVEEA